MKLNTIMIIKNVFVFLSIMMLTSCTLFSPVNLETKKYVIDKIPTNIPKEQTHAVTLLILPPETKAIYNTTQMAYTTQPYKIAYFSQNEWGETPAKMIQPLIVKTLQNTHYFNTIVTPPYSRHYTYVLRTQILELLQDYTSQPAMLRLSIRFQLSDGSDNQVIGSKELTVNEPLSTNTPYAGVIAANQATAKILHDELQNLFQSIILKNKVMPQCSTHMNKYQE